MALRVWSMSSHVSFLVIENEVNDPMMNNAYKAAWDRLSVCWVGGWEGESQGHYNRWHWKQEDTFKVVHDPGPMSDLIR